MFLLYWEVHALMELAVNLRNEDLHWFSRKRTFIYGGVDSRVTSSVFILFCVSLWTTNFSSCIREYLKIVEAKSL